MLIFRCFASEHWIVTLISSVMSLERLLLLISGSAEHFENMKRRCSFHFSCCFQNFGEGSSYCMHFFCWYGCIMWESSTVCIVLEYSHKAYMLICFWSSSLDVLCLMLVQVDKNSGHTYRSVQLHFLISINGHVIGECIKGEFFYAF